MIEEHNEKPIHVSQESCSLNTVRQALSPKRVAALLIIVVCLISSLPFLTRLNFHGDDIYFHLSRIAGLSNALKHGQFPAHMHFHQIGGYGYPASIMYGDLLLYIPALLHLFGFSLTTSYKLFVCLINMASTVITYAVFKRIFNSRFIGIIGSVFWTLSIYRLTNIYIRAAVGEYSAMLFFPVLLYGIWSCLQTTKPGASKHGGLWCGIALTGIITAHVLSILMLAIVLIPIFIWILAKQFNKYVFKQVGIAIAVSTLLSLFFIVPFCDYSRTVDMSVYSFTYEERINRLKGWGLEPVELLTLFHQFKRDQPSSIVHPGYPFSIGWGILGGIFLGLLVCFCLKRESTKRVQFVRGAMISTSIAAALSFLIITAFIPWDLPPVSSLGGILGAIQFPWRFVGILTFLLIILSLTGISYAIRDPRIGRISIFFAVCVLLLSVLEGGVAGSNIFSNAKRIEFNDEIARYSVSSGLAGEEYVPANTNINKLFPNNKSHPGKPKTTNMQISDYQDTDTQITFRVSTQQAAGNIVFPRFAYPNYRLECSDQPNCKLDSTRGDTNLLTATIPANYAGQVTLKYEIPVIWRISDLISCVAWILLIFYAIRQGLRKSKVAQQLFPGSKSKLTSMN